MAEMKLGEEFKGYLNALSKLEEKEETVIKKAVYAGGGVMADAIKDALKTLPIQEGENGLPEMGTSEHPLTGVSRKQKADLIDSMGMAPIQEFKKGYISTKIGWDGYGSVKTKKYPKGVPNQMLMRSVESGTSFRKKNPVIRKAVTKNKKATEEKMKDVVDNEIKKIMEG